MTLGGAWAETSTVEAHDFSHGSPDNGETLAFRCGECGNSDETLVEIRHDEDCSLAGRFGPMAAPGRAARTDGGE